MTGAVSGTAMPAFPPAAVEEAPAVRDLGPLFRVTDVFLWDDAVVDFSEAWNHRRGSAEQLTNFCTTDADSNVEPSINDYTSVEDSELAQQMGEMGLPISFSTSREKRNTGAGAKRKGTKVKLSSANKEMENRISGLYKSSEWEDVTSSIVLNDSTNIQACCDATKIKAEASCDDYQEEHSRGDSHPDGESIHVAASILCEKGRARVPYKPSTVALSDSEDKELKSEDDDLEKNAERLPGNDLEDSGSKISHAEKLSSKQDEASFSQSFYVPCHKTSAGDDDDVDRSVLGECFNSEAPSISCSFADHRGQVYPDNSVFYEFGDWTAAWDAFYMRYYFYNCQTQESTWYPPAGWEHFAHSCSITNTTDMIGDVFIEDADLEFGQESIKGQDAFSLRDTTDSFHGDNSYDSVTLFSVEVSSKNKATGISVSRIDSPSTNCGSELLDKHVEVKQVTFYSSDVKDCSTDALVSECLVTQEDSIIQPEACDVPANFLEFSTKSSSTATLNEMDYREISTGDSLETFGISMMDELNSRHQEYATGKEKQRVRRPQPLNGGLSVNILKYWCQRYLLFSRFDSGIKMDEEGWFSVTPESIARHHASRCGCGTVIDCFSGVGGNAIQFAMKSIHVIAIDIDPQKIDYAQHNAAIYGVNDKIDFIIADFFQMAPRLKGDAVFMSPPWGGPDYSKVQTYNIATMLQPHNGYSLFKIAKAIAPKIVMFLPRNVDLNQLAELSLSVNPPCALEVEKNYLNGKLKAITAYFDIREV